MSKQNNQQRTAAVKRLTLKAKSLHPKLNNLGKRKDLREVVQYFADVAEFTDFRQSQNVSEATETKAANAMPKDSVKI